MYRRIPTNIIIIIAKINPMIANGFFSFFFSKATRLIIIVNGMPIYCIIIKNFGKRLVASGCKINNNPAPNDV